ncbi:MAG TPA: aspartate/glutamate racemase family protein [Thermoanaerobaculia bacterium]|nr:aspartate/glutamate racemase family protein [Thermoanaerobaculia bacterium]
MNRTSTPFATPGAVAPAFAVGACTEFVRSGEAIEATQSYIRRLSAAAVRRRVRGEEVCDQDFPAEIFALRPPRATGSPLVLLGGMGPLAGAEGFARACSLFGESREIVLLQACSIPDRTQAILADARSATGVSMEHQVLVSMLDAARQAAIDRVITPHGAIDVVMLCNAAHAFLPHAFLPEGAARPGNERVRSISLVDCVVDALRRRSGPALILSAEGTRLSRIYTRRLAEARIPYVEPSERLQRMLMRAIYEGVKAFDWKAAAENGAAVLEELLSANPDVECIVAGCTEIPKILDTLKSVATQKLVERLSLEARLSRVEILDPVELAFRR